MNALHLPLLALTWPETFASSWKEIIELAIIAGGFGFTIMSLRLLRTQLREQQDHRDQARAESRIARAFELDARLQQLAEQRSIVDGFFNPESYKDEAVPLERVKAVLQENPSAKATLHTLLAFWEMLAITVSAGATDENMAYEMIKSTLIGYCQRFRLYIEDVQQHGKRHYCVYLLHLSQQWQQRRMREQTAGQSPYFLRAAGDAQLAQRSVTP